MAHVVSCVRVADEYKPRMMDDLFPAQSALLSIGDKYLKYTQWINSYHHDIPSHLALTPVYSPHDEHCPSANSYVVHHTICS
jgi:hypothetical protein